MSGQSEYSPLMWLLPRFRGDRSRLSPSERRRVEWYESNTKMASLAAHPTIVFGPRTAGSGPTALRLVCQCMRCGESFRPKQLANVRYCSVRCAALHREVLGVARSKANAKRFPQPMAAEVVFCEECGAEVPRLWRTRRFCSNACRSTKQYREMPDYLGIKGARGRPKRYTAKWAESAKRRGEQLRGRVVSPEVRVKVADGLRRSWDARKQAGGYPMYLAPAVRLSLLRRRTPAQRQLMEALGLTDDQTEVPLKINDRMVFVDLLVGQLAIEIDGSTHAQRQQRQLDIERGAALRMLGYTVLRFWNWEVEENLSEVVQQIRSSMT